jgi:hypothetical protein
MGLESSWFGGGGSWFCLLISSPDLMRSAAFRIVASPLPSCRWSWVSLLRVGGGSAGPVVFFTFVAAYGFLFAGLKFVDPKGFLILALIYQRELVREMFRVGGHFIRRLYLYRY